MARKRQNTFTIRLSDSELERLERESERREIPKAQLFREFLKFLEENSKAS